MHKKASSIGHYNQHYIMNRLTIYAKENAIMANEKLTFFNS